MSPCASTRRSAASPISCPTSCGGCSRTAPTPRSCTRSPIPDVPLEALVADPVAALPEPYEPDPRIPLPRDLYPDRAEFAGPRSCPSEKSSTTCSARIVADREARAARRRRRHLAAGARLQHRARRRRLRVLVARARRASAPRVLERAADALEARMVELVSLIVREGGRTYADAVVRGARGGRFLPLLRPAGENEFRHAACCFPARPASATSSRCTAAACSPASARGISRSPSSPARSPPRSPPATR